MVDDSASEQERNLLEKCDLDSIGQRTFEKSNETMRRDTNPNRDTFRLRGDEDD